MKKRSLVVLGAAMVVALTAGVAYADFSPNFTMELSDTKLGGNPAIDLRLEFDAEDEEIGNFQLVIPKGFNIAADDAIEDTSTELPNGTKTGGEEIGGGTIVIEAGPACRPGPEGAIPVSGPVTLDATIYERDRTDAEADSGVHSVWFLDLEPLNRVRLLVKGSPETGWTVDGAPTPSDNTCNPLEVDLTINAQSASGVPIVTNPVKGKKAVFTANIASQDSASVATFTYTFPLTK